MQDLYSPEMILASVLTMLVVVAVTPVVRGFAHRIGWVDNPNERKMHKVPTPSIGGLVFVPAALVAWLMFGGPELINAETVSLVMAVIVMFLLGAYDDRWPLSHRIKLPIQILVSSGLIYTWDLVPIEFGGALGIHDIEGIWAWALMLMFFQFAINAINYTDGLNGLLGSYTTVVFVTLASVLCATGCTQIGSLLPLMAAGIVGFLVYNFRKEAKTFMGDAGSTVIGLLSALAVAEFIKSEPVYMGMPSFYLVALLFWYPLLDSLQVYVIRILSGTSPFFPDKRHLHHMFIKRFQLDHRVFAVVVGLITVAIAMWALGCLAA